MSLADPYLVLLAFLAAIPQIVTIALCGLALLLQYLWFTGKETPHDPSA